MQKHTVTTDNISDLKHHPGTYRFYDKQRVLLYIGKSKHVRKRVNTHFRPHPQKRKQRKIITQTTRIEVDYTAGELGALLLELKQIKTLQPVLNKQSRRQRRLVIAQPYFTDDGFLTVSLKNTRHIRMDDESNLFGIFRSRKQAKSTIDALAKRHALCKRVLGFAVRPGKGPCFQRQIKRCKGACVGVESPTSHNQRFRKAFTDYTIRTWPYAGTHTLSERRDGRCDSFTLDKWCLINAKTEINGESRPFFETESTATLQTFDYDMYKVLLKFL